MAGRGAPRRARERSRRGRLRLDDRGRGRDPRDHPRPEPAQRHGAPTVAGVGPRRAARRRADQHRHGVRDRAHRPHRCPGRLLLSRAARHRSPPCSRPRLPRRGASTAPRHRRCRRALRRRRAVVPRSRPQRYAGGAARRGRGTRPRPLHRGPDAVRRRRAAARVDRRDGAQQAAVRRARGGRERCAAWESTTTLTMLGDGPLLGPGAGRRTGVRRRRRAAGRAARHHGVACTAAHVRARGAAAGAAGGRGGRTAVVRLRHPRRPRRARAPRPSGSSGTRPPWRRRSSGGGGPEPRRRWSTGTRWTGGTRTTG